MPAWKRLMFRLFLLLCCLQVVIVQPGFARRQVLHGPVEADVLGVRDGDTLLVRAHIWPGQHVEVFVRIRGIDAPELKGRCSRERQLARAARSILKDLVGEGRVRLFSVSGGKYFGRVLADVATETGSDVQTKMLISGFVRPYRGRKRQSWCDSPSF